MLRPVRRLADLKQELHWAEQAQAQWGLAMGEGKCELVARWVGPGSRRMRRRVGTGVVSSSGFRVPVHWEAKYLEAVASTLGRLEKEAQSRMHAGRVRKIQLQRSVFSKRWESLPKCACTLR